ncbi:VCBS repeat-containing protein [Hellea sp.]|nr:VCBS repeat-containing protein [Hellea sp.]
MSDKSSAKFKPGLRHLIWCALVIGVGALIFFILSAFGVFRYWQAEKIPQGETTLKFSEVDLPFSNVADLDNSLPFLASAAIDIDGDGQDELFLGGGNRQADQFLRFQGGKFVPMDMSISKGDVDATHGAATMDIDNDGDTDLLVARESGIWYHENQGGSFGSVNLNLPLADNTTPLSIGLADINQDGLADMYVAGYIKLSLVEGETNFDKTYGGYSYLFLNDGNGGWTDISKSAGVFRKHNTFIGLFADLDNDLDSDLIIAQDTGVVEMYSNNGDMTFDPIPNPSVFSYPMGVAAGDYDNDGLIDLYFSNVGYTLPPAVLKGNLEKDDPFNPAYYLFHNDGGLKFSDRAEAMNAARYGFGWGTVFADMNLDGKEDLLFAQNYARFPAQKLLAKYPGKILQNYGDKFQPVEKVAGAENKNYAISPIISDFNQDGWPDLIWANLDGESLAYINQGGHDNWLKVRLPNVARSINARVMVTDNSGQTFMKQFITSQGLGSDQGRDLIFGLDGTSGPYDVRVEFQDGSSKSMSDQAAGQLLTIAAPTP